MFTIRLLIFSVLALLLSAVLSAQDTQYPPQGEQIPGPPIARDSSEHCCERGEQPGSSRSIAEAWLADIRHWRSEEHTSELQSRLHLVCRLLLEKKKTISFQHRLRRSCDSVVP